MSKKKILYKVMGDGDPYDKRYLRTANSKGAYDRCVKEFSKKTWQEKAKPRSNWYPEIPDIHIYGDKK